MTTQTEPEPICCPKFDPIPWDDKTFDWQNRNFIKDRVFTFLYMPFGFGKVMKKLDEKVTAAGATIPDNLCLSDHTSKWNMDLYLAVDKNIPEAENIQISGKFYSRVYEGPYKDTGKWHQDFVSACKSKGYITSKYYTWYTTCPKCAKKYGKNYVVIMAKID